MYHLIMFVRLAWCTCRRVCRCIQHKWDWSNQNGNQVWIFLKYLPLHSPFCQRTGSNEPRLANPT